VDENGQRVGVLLDIEDYRQLLEDVEELEAIRAYDAAKASGDEAVPLEQAFAEIENDEGCVIATASTHEQALLFLKSDNVQMLFGRES
jgi:hypothetical protein